MLGLVLTVVVVGVVAGAVAPLLVPGRRNMPVVVTVVLGLLGSGAGGLAGHLFFGSDAVGVFSSPGGVTGAVVGAVVVLLLFVAFGRRPPEDA